MEMELEKGFQEEMVAPIKTVEDKAKLIPAFLQVSASSSSAAQRVFSVVCLCKRKEEQKKWDDMVLRR